MTEHWPWLAAGIFLLVFEFWAITTKHRTLSQRARSLQTHYPWAPWVVIAATVILYGHFWLGWFW